MARPLRPYSQSTDLDNDPHVSLLLAILRGVPRERRLAWMENNLPITSAMLGVARSWSALSVLPGGGDGAISRRAPAERRA